MSWLFLKLSSYLLFSWRIFRDQGCHESSVLSPHQKCQYPMAVVLFIRMTYTEACAIRLRHVIFLDVAVRDTNVFVRQHVLKIIVSSCSTYSLNERRWWRLCEKHASRKCLNRPVVAGARTCAGCKQLKDTDTRDDVALTGSPQTHFLDDDTTFSGLRGGWKSDRVLVIQRHPKTPSRPSRTKCLQYCCATVFQHHSIFGCSKGGRVWLKMVQLVAEGSTALRLTNWWLSHHQSQKQPFSTNFFWLGGSICLEAKISYFQSLAWCLLQKSFKGQSFFSATTCHKTILTNFFKMCPKI